MLACKPHTRTAGSRPPFRAWRLGRAVLLVLAASTWGIGAAADQPYDFMLVEAFDPTYDLREVILRDINELNLVSGTSTYEGFYAGFVWTEQTDKVIIPLVWPQGVNNLNQVVSNGTIYDFDSGESVSVPPAGGYPVTRLQAINDGGVAVGYSECACSNSDGMLQDALVWDALQGSRTIPVPNAKELVRINDGNLAAGNIRGGSAGSEGFVYDIDTGEYVNITDMLPPYMYGRGWSQLRDISESALVVGRGWDGQYIRGLTYSDDQGLTFLPPVPGGLIDRVYPQGVNTAGTVVGFADITLHVPHAFVWDAQNGMRDLNDLVEAPAGFILDWANKVNDNGWIIGIGHYGPGWGTSRGFVLRPRGTTVPVGGEVASMEAPDVRLFPNPVVDRLEIRFALPEPGPARLSVFDVSGREVARLIEGDVSPRHLTVSWSPDPLQPSGVYYARLDAQGIVLTRRFTLVR